MGRILEKIGEILHIFWTALPFIIGAYVIGCVMYGVIRRRDELKRENKKYSFIDFSVSCYYAVRLFLDHIKLLAEMIRAGLEGANKEEKKDGGKNDELGVSDNIPGKK